MSILDNEGHDPNGLGNRPPRNDVDHESIAAHFERELIEACREKERLWNFVRFVNLWCNRKNVTDAERVSAIKFHPVAHQGLGIAGTEQSADKAEG